ncbi:MAG: chitobiase/beta-hexosaminidase C-terminal domain-containing protein [Opitutaceae bacterium]|jgi:hypothetical protein
MNTIYSSYFVRPSARSCPWSAVAASALFLGLSLTARAQIGTGWTSTTETYSIQTSAGCTAVPLPSGIGGVFSVPSGAGRAEFRFTNLSATVTEQFQGNVTVNSLGGNEITMKQTFGPDPSTPWSLIAIKTSSGTDEIYELEGGAVLLKPYSVGNTLRINTIYNPTGGAGHVTVDVYINGTHVEQKATGTGPNYNKVGAYVSASGTGPATFTWQNVMFWTGGSINGGTPVAVDTPSFNPAAGIYAAGQSVTLSSTTSGASIRYTTDGSTPTETSGILYSTAIPANASMTINAIAYKSGQTDSPVTTAAYTINPAATPTFSPVAGRYTTAQVVTISSATSGATLSYTTDGSTPTETHGTLLANGGTISIGTVVTLEAIAFKAGYADSAVATAGYIIVSPVATPTFSPPAGTYSSVQMVTISSATPGAFLNYTTDGSAPTETHGTSVPNGGSVAIGTSVTLKAIAYAGGYSDSAVASGGYTINLAAAQPTFSPVGGTYTSALSVTLSSATGGASIAYTTDSSTPTESGGTVTHGTLLANGGSVAISATKTLKAIAFESGFADSAVDTAAYTLVSPAATPTFSPVAGTYTNAQSVTIKSTTSGASIAYTTDGSTPIESGGTVTHGALLANGGSVAINANATLTALAFESGLADSATGAAIYTITPPAASPTFSPVAGTYSSAQSVTVSSTTTGATIIYTTDGTTPAESGGTPTGTAKSLSNGGSVAIGSTLTLKAIAYKSGDLDSASVSGLYTVNIPLQVATPTFSPVAGTYTSAQSVTLGSATNGASIAYTTDSSTPTESHGTVVSNGGSLSLSTTTTLKAMAFKSGQTDSTVAMGTYSISAPVPTAPRIDGSNAER